MKPPHVVRCSALRAKLRVFVFLCFVSSPAFAEGSGSDFPSPGLGSSLETTGVLYDAKEGPWGSLQYYYFYLEAPLHLVEILPLRNPRTRWVVPLREEASLRSILDRVNLTPEQRAALLHPDNTGVAEGLFVLFPSADVLVSLDPVSRETIYNYLDRFDMNPDIDEPVRVFSGSVDEWAMGTGIRPELVERIRRMTYERNGLTLFSDFPYIISQATSESEARELQKHSSRVRSMMVRLNVSGTLDLDEVLDYWSTGLGLRRKEIVSIIEAGTMTPGVNGLDIVHLLPALPRKFLYTYPDIGMAIHGTLPDCHWTALNFFSYEPQPFYLEERFAAISLLENFEQVPAPYKYGDVLVFVTPQMSAHHSCIYVAADIVYTKNGGGLYSPWTMLQLSDVQKLYSDYKGTPLRIQGFRAKPKS